MISIDTIENEILELEARDTSWSNVEHLAWLYVVRDHLKKPTCDESTGELIGDEFVAACSNVPMQALMNILSEHMEAINLLYPKEFDAIMAQIKRLKE